MRSAVVAVVVAVVLALAGGALWLLAMAFGDIETRRYMPAYFLLMPAVISDVPEVDVVDGSVRFRSAPMEGTRPQLSAVYYVSRASEDALWAALEAHAARSGYRNHDGAGFFTSDGADQLHIGVSDACAARLTGTDCTPGALRDVRVELLQW